MKNIPIPPGFHPVRHDRHEIPWPARVHDTYKSRGKLPEPAVCPQCNAVYQEGRWRWGDVPANAHRELCPACHRTNDNCPAGFVALQGPFFLSHRAEITSLVQHEEQHAKQEHPLVRIMAMEEQQDGVSVTTTDIHLARSIGEAVHRAYQGELEIHYNPEENLVRVSWTR